MAEIPQKPYLIRAIYEWCNDSGLTPYLGVRADQNTRVPMEYVKNGEIVLSITQQATRNLTISNDLIQFSARFNGVSREISVPIYAVSSIFARETGKGLFFEPEKAPAPADAPRPQTAPALEAVGGSAKVSAIGGDGEAEPKDDIAATDEPKGPPKTPPRGGLKVVK